MTYIRRAVKYLIQLTLIFLLIVGILMLAGMIPQEVSLAFRKGWESVWLILALFAAMAAVYPLFGYGKRTIRTAGDPAEKWETIDQAMDARGYVKMGEGESRRYHLKSAVSRAARLWEDTITITTVLGGFQAEGLVRDLARVVMSLDHKLNRYE